ncbi:hypothetical protein NQ317_000142 [Molorchus minor]|uniref:Uncharacterized protein n=1 Tax=Molorchus minor TaxID=1323400 RepID=A0ABQ9JFB7_9CUCU|nr:hypothetical protein NQ317_000142 [Molorchus minor]
MNNEVRVNLNEINIKKKKYVSRQLPLIRDNYLFNFTLLSFPGVACVKREQSATSFPTQFLSQILLLCYPKRSSCNGNSVKSTATKDTKIESSYCGKRICNSAASVRGMQLTQQIVKDKNPVTGSLCPFAPSVTNTLPTRTIIRDTVEKWTPPKSPIH